MHRLVYLAVGLTVVALAAGRPASARAQASVDVTLATTDTGFDCRAGCDHVTFKDPWQPTIDVPLSSLVNFTFEWDHQGYVNDEHIMVLAGYGLEWDKIDRANRSATLQLIADKPGDFNIKCDTECETHDYMQHVTLRVGETGGGAAAAKTATTLTIKPSEGVTTGEPVNLMVTLKGDDGRPVTKAHVDFFVDTTFVGTDGSMKVGGTDTDDNGVAFFDFQPTLPAGSETVQARFAGQGIYDAADAQVVLQTIGRMPPAYSVPNPGLGGLRGAMPRVFGLTILALWLILGYVVLQIIGIARAG